MSRTHRWLIVAGLLVALAALALAVEIFLPYRPTQAEAIDAVVIPFGHEAKVVHIVDRVPRSVLLALQIDQPTVRCFELHYVTRHWLSGTRGYATVSTYQPLSPSSPHLDALTFTSRQVNGTYALFGAVADEHIASVRGQWSDGRVQSVPLQEGTFFLFREADDLHIEWVVGLDAEGHELADTKMESREGYNYWP